MTLHFSSGEQTAWRASKYKIQMASPGFSDRPSYHKILMCVWTHTYVYVCEEYIHIHVHPYTIYELYHIYEYVYTCIYVCIYIISLSLFQNPCSLNYTLADIVPFDLKQEEGTPYGWRHSVSLTETHTPPPSNSCKEPLPKSLLSTVSQ